MTSEEELIKCLKNALDENDALNIKIKDLNSEIDDLKNKLKEHDNWRIISHTQSREFGRSYTKETKILERYHP